MSDLDYVPKTVVIVDDAPPEADVMDRILRKIGFRTVARAHDGVEGIARVREHRPEVVIMDVILPQMNGIEAAQIITNQKLCRYLIAASGSGQSSVANQMMGAGAIWWIAKPYDDIGTQRDLKRLFESLEKTPEAG